MSADLSLAVRGARMLYDYGARQVWICGSLAHGRHWDAVSDVDYAVAGMSDDNRRMAASALSATSGRAVDVFGWEDAPAHLRVQVYAAMMPVDRMGVIGPMLRGQAPPVTTLAARPLPRGLHRRRHAHVVSVLTRAGATDVLDVGCGDGELVRALAGRDGVRVTGVDRDPAAIATAAANLGAVLTTEQLDRVRLGVGRAEDLEPWWRGQDAVVAVEVIEHLDAPVLDAFVTTTLGVLRPATVVLTTPNADYNALFPGTGLRHADHRFEWGRAEMRAWADGIAGPHGYTVAMSAVGVPHPEYGAPSQLCTFVRVGGR